MGNSRRGKCAVVALVLLAFGLSLPALAQQQYGPTALGEGVYSIARKFRSPQSDLNLRQWALAIYATNRQAFGPGLNDLRAGVMLDIPSATEVRQNWAQGARLNAASTTQRAATTIAPAAAPLSDSQAAAVDRLQAVPAPIGADTLVTPPTHFTNGLDQPPSSPTRVQATAAPAGDATRAANSLPLADADRRADATPPFSENPLYSQVFTESQRADAVAQLSALEAEYAGDPDFDYVYGVALLDNARPQDALFPLLRAAQMRPLGLGIRLDLGRAYFETGENESARQVFEQLNAHNPPPRAAQVIDSYLQAIERRAARYQPHWKARIDLRAGHDSNANSATDLQSFAGFILDEQARSSDSPYAALAGNVQFIRPFSPRWRWLNMAQLSHRAYTDASEFNSQQWRLASGLSYRQGDWELSSRISAGQTYLDGDANNDTAALNGAWRLDVSPRFQTRMQFKVGTVRYDDALSVRDVDQWLMSAGLSRRTTLAYGGEVGLDLIGGHDEAVEKSSPYGRDVFGAGLFAATQLSPRWRLHANSNFLQSRYDGAFFGIERNDVQWFTVAGLRMTDNRLKDWAFSLELSYVDNQSDVELYEYDRFDLALSVSWMLK